jgi:hypothetical protein
MRPGSRSSGRKPRPSSQLLESSGALVMVDSEHFRELSKIAADPDTWAEFETFCQFQVSSNSKI